MIYFDNAATSLPKPKVVVDAVSESLMNYGNASRGLHSASMNALKKVYETRKLIAEFFGFRHPERVIFTANGTQSLNMAIRGILKPGDHVITTILEHNSVLRPLYLMEESGVKITIVKGDVRGMISYDEVKAAIQENTKALICTHASNVTGDAINLEEFGDLCYKHNIKFIVDAAQSAGILPIHMEQYKISILCFSGHKGLLGPQGIGGLCIHENVEISSCFVGGTGIESYSKFQPKGMPESLEAGTLNSHGIAGLHAGIRYLMQNKVEIRKKEIELTKRFYTGIQNIPSVVIYGNHNTDYRTPVVALNIGTYDSGMVSDALFLRYQIATRSGAHCAPLLHQAIGTMNQGIVRFSFSFFNSNDEIDIGIQGIRELACEEVL